MSWQESATEKGLGLATVKLQAASMGEAGVSAELEQNGKPSLGKLSIAWLGPGDTAEVATKSVEFGGVQEDGAGPAQD